MSKFERSQFSFGPRRARSDYFASARFALAFTDVVNRGVEADRPKSKSGQQDGQPDQPQALSEQAFEAAEQIGPERHLAGGETIASATDPLAPSPIKTTRQVQFFEDDTGQKKH